MKIGIAGAAGRMGRALVRAVCDHPGLVLAGAWEGNDHPALGQDVGVLAGCDACSVMLTDSASAVMAACDAIIDFTAPEVSIGIARDAEVCGCALVIGTTGFSQDQLAMLEKAGEKIPVVYATNFSTGVNVLWSLAEQAARLLGEQYDAEIVEIHHNQKKDAPSGTAVTLLEAIGRGKGLDPRQSVRYGREGMIGARKKSEIGVHSVRAGDIVGEHSALFAGPNERIEIKHLAHSRDVFARGAARAAAWLEGKKAGFYHMRDVLGIQ